MAYIDPDYIDDMLGSDVRTGLFTDDGTYNTSGEAKVADSATARVRTALSVAGYSPPTDAEMVVFLAGTEAQKGEANTIQLACLGVWIGYAYGRKQIDVPPGHEDKLDQLARIEDGEIQFDALTYSSEAGIGGVKSSETSPTASLNKAQIFNRDMGR